MDSPGGGAVSNEMEATDVEIDDARPSTGEEEHGATFWIAVAIGWTAIGIGLFGVFDHSTSVHAFKLLRLLIGLNIVNDAIIVPVVLGIAYVVRRKSPRWLMAPAQVWLMMCGVICLYAYPFVGDYGRMASNPSLLPFNYAHRLLLLLGIITAACSVLAFISWRRARPSEV
jgi:hypothetical protein